MIHYCSTRGQQELVSFSEAILQGIASDGGLFVPEHVPQLPADMLSELAGKSYHEIALAVLFLFEIGFPKHVLRSLLNSAYGRQFDTPEIAPIRLLKEKQYLLELWHGPTLAFKDMALQLMPLFFSEAAKVENKRRIKRGFPPLSYLLLVATSGDTGKAALEGYQDKDTVSIVVLYPHKRVSVLQELQMTTQEGKNVAVFALSGDFDAAQRCVKEIFRDNVFATVLAERNVVLSSANSINWGRLLPQIVYYVSGYLQMVRQGALSLDEEIDVCVPTGNFGNILAAVYAKQMGLPIRKLVCASNENNVLTEFLRTGMYDLRKRSLLSTPAPSMDILVASNVERLLYLLTSDTKKVSRWMNDLSTKKFFLVDPVTKNALRTLFVSDFVANDDCLRNIKYVFTEIGYLCDPHTSIAQLVAERQMNNVSDSVPMLIVSTAHFSKFASSVAEALFEKRTLLQDEFRLLAEVFQKTGLSLPAKISALEKQHVRFSEVVATDVPLLENRLLSFLQM